MKFPNWFRVVWWALLSSVLTWFLWRRYPDLIQGAGTPADIVVFIVWLSLLLTPVFAETSILGFQFKQEVEKLKQHLDTQLASLRVDLSSVIDVRTSISPQIFFPSPPPDAQLPALEASIKKAVAESMKTYGAPTPVQGAPMPVSDNVQFLFATRYTIERELRRIVRDRRILEPERRPVATMQLTRALLGAEAIDFGIERAIREVYSICSPAVHGEPVSEAQVAFVRDVAPGVIATLKAIT